MVCSDVHRYQIGGDTIGLYFIYACDTNTWGRVCGDWGGAGRGGGEEGGCPVERVNLTKIVNERVDI